MKKLRLGCLLATLLLSGSAVAQTIALIADLNGRYGSTVYNQRVGDAIDTIIGMQPDLVISTGDMVAGQKQPKLDRDRLDRMWQEFNRVVADPFSRAGIPFAVTPGNHDGSGFPEYALEQARFKAQWESRIPELEFLPGSEWPRRYAARMGRVLLLGFDGTVPGKLSPSEFQFIERMLQAYGASAGVTLVYSHLPMWPLAQGRKREILGDPDLLSLLHSHGVDAYISGHHHVFYPGIDSAGMVHLGVAALGGNARRVVGQDKRQPFSYAVLELSNNQLDVRSFAAPGFSGKVPVKYQPGSIEGPLGLLRRLDGPVDLREIKAED